MRTQNMYGIRRGSGGNGDRFSITERAKAPPYKEGGQVQGHATPQKRLDFNAVKCHFPGFRVFRTGYWPGFKVKA